jgi:hypothetical protein
MCAALRRVREKQKERRVDHGLVPLHMRVRYRVTPRFGDSMASVSHLHRAVRLDGTSSIVRYGGGP